MDDFGRRQVEITLSARVAGVSKVPQSIYGSGSPEPTVSKEDLYHFGSTKPDWPAIGHSTLNDKGMSWLCLTPCGGRWSKMRSSWLRLLAIPNTIMVHKDRPQCLLVLETSAFGFVSWRTPVG